MAFAERRSPGARGRIGIIQPAPGVMIEHEWPRYLPEGMLFPVGRVRLTSGTADGYAKLARAAPDCARDLAAAGCGVIAYACAVGSLYAGPKVEAKLLTTLEATSSKPAVSLAESSVRALRHLGVAHPTILTPYDAATNRWVTDYLAALGIGAEGVSPTPVDIFTVGDIQPDEIVALALAALAAAPAADSLWIPCTAIQTLEAIAQIEECSGKPVVSGSQALLWAGLRALGINTSIPAVGRLLA